MTFNPSIPKSTDLLSNSQADLLANNGALNASFSRNHIALNIATNNGKHTFIEMPVSAAIPTPIPALINGEGTLYTKNVATTSSSELFYTPDTSGTEYQVTPCFPVRMSVNFDGTGPNGAVAPGLIRSSFNVASITKNGTGDYTITFTNPTPTANYFLQGIGMRSTSNDISNVQLRGDATYSNSCSTTFVRFQTNGGTSTLQDVLMLNVIVLGG